MSPAKRISRRRFRALCERCRRWEWDDTCDAERWRVIRFVRTMEMSHRLRGSRRPYADAMVTVNALARLA